MSFTAMVVPVGSWRFTSVPDESWTQVALSTMTQVESFDQEPSDIQLVESFHLRLNSLRRQLKQELGKNSRASDLEVCIQHFELYLFDKTMTPSYEEFMLFLSRSLHFTPLSHIRFDWKMAMPVMVLQPS